ncbi:hypothetical protein CFELI_11810 [Corynebacterium felinum]|nr:hypothetical protein CFELI_11810 [Corynebacterium felinum]
MQEYDLRAFIYPEKVTDVNQISRIAEKLYEVFDRLPEDSLKNISFLPDSMRIEIRASFLADSVGKAINKADLFLESITREYQNSNDLVLTQGTNQLTYA